MERLYDVVIVGGGPAGLTAALYLARARYRVLVLEREQFGGQISITEEVVNYPGIQRISGKALTQTMQRQAESFGAEFKLAEAVGFDLAGDIKIVRTNVGEFRCFGVLLATGAHPKNVGFKGEEEYKGRGVAYCATCDGEFFAGKEIFVVGGGYAAAEESVFLTKFASHVTILIRKADFSCAASVAEKAKNHPKITVLTNTVLEEVSGQDKLTYARYKNSVTGEVTEYRNDNGFGVFVLAGYAPATEKIREIVDCDDYGYVLTDASRKTNIDGVYAAGDVCVKPLRQVVTATGDGALAATQLEKYVASMHQKTGIIPEFSAPEEKTVPQEPEEKFHPEMRQQLDSVFSRMERNLLLKLSLDHRPVSVELKEFVTSLANLSEKLRVQIQQENPVEKNAPCVSICREDGSEMGLRFHGVPGGHEFTSFIMGIYNAAGPGQTLDEGLKARIAALRPAKLQILVTLSCSMCPELVIGAQCIAAENSGITADVYDIAHFDEVRNRYRVMSVPCLVINEEQVTFGKKTLPQLIDYLETL